MAIQLRVNGRPHSIDVDPATPLLYVLSGEHADASRHQAVRAGGESMRLTPDARAAMTSRRNFIKGTGAFFVAFSGLNVSALAQRLDGAGSNQLDSWIAIASDGSVTAY